MRRGRRRNDSDQKFELFHTDITLAMSGAAQYFSSVCNIVFHQLGVWFLAALQVAHSQPLCTDETDCSNLVLKDSNQEVTKHLILPISQ